MYADTDLMKKAAEDIKVQTNKYNHSVQELNMLMKALEKSWSDEAATKLIGKYNQTTNSNLKNLERLLNEFHTALENTAGEYDNAVKNISNNV